MNEEPRRDVVSSGNSEIDGRMGGGIPVRSLTLIDGDSSAGKSVLIQQLIWGSLNDDHTACLFTTENSVRSLITQMQSLDLDVLDFLLLNKFKVYPMPVTRLKETGFPLLLQAISREQASDLVFLDSLTFLFFDALDEEILAFCERCKFLCSQGMSILMVVHSHALKPSLLIRLRSLCDCHLRLRTEELGEKLVKTLEVSKVRGADKTTGNIVSFEIEPGWGMRIIPISKASV